MTFAIFATLASAMSNSARYDHIAGTCRGHPPRDQHHQRQLYTRHFNSKNATFKYPHSNLPPKRSTAAWRMYPSFLGLVIIKFCLPAKSNNLPQNSRQTTCLQDTGHVASIGGRYERGIASDGYMSGLTGSPYW
jgi:hypothetical protein